MKITYIESPESLVPESTQWEQLKQQILAESTDVLVTNEMPFGQWLAAQPLFSELHAKASVIAHQQGVEALKQLNIPLVISSRPLFHKHKLVNEAFALFENTYHAIHHKHYFPEEAGFYEHTWFEIGKEGFEVIHTPLLTVGTLLCTELMFNEHARSYKHQGAQLIVAPRATPVDSEQSLQQWKTAAAMAAIVSGCYVVSSNRVGAYSDDLVFEGKGFAFAPDGSLISETSLENPVVSFDMDLQVVKNQQKQYPCYVREITSAKTLN